MMKGKRIEIKAGGNVNLSADEVGRDKVTVSMAKDKEGKRRFNLLGWVGTIPVFVKLAEFLGLSISK